MTYLKKSIYLYSIFFLLCMILFQSSCVLGSSLNLFESSPDSPVVLQVDSMEFKEGRLLCSGKVILEHYLGKIVADRAELIEFSKTDDGQLDHLILSGNVSINFYNGDELKCDQAEFNFTDLTGNFLGNKEGRVHYQTCLNVKKDSLFSINSNSIKVLFFKEENKKKHDGLVEHIDAKGEVSFANNKGFKVEADYLVFQSEQALQAKEIKKNLFDFYGEVYLFPDMEKGTCQISLGEHSLVHADQIRINTIEDRCFFNNASGKFSILQGNNISSELSFSSIFSLWDHNSQQLILKDNVELKQKGFGVFKTDKELTVQFEHQKKELSAITYIESEGKTTFNYLNKDKKPLELSCNGYLMVDYITKKIDIDSYYDENKQVEDGQQVRFKDERGEIYANKVSMYYDVLSDSIDMERLSLLGNVKIINRNFIARSPETVKEKGEENKVNSSLSKKDSFLVPLDQPRYALADKLEYDPKTEKMYLLAEKDKRVLYYDAEKELRVSAPAIEILRDASQGEEVFRGVGDVRFTFAETEFQKLSSLLRLESIIKTQKFIRQEIR